MRLPAFLTRTRVWSATGAAVGWIGGAAAIRAAPGAGAGDGSADRYRGDSLWRLETPAARADAVRRHRGGRRACVAAVPQKRMAKVPIWASIVTPIVLAFVIPYWGVFLAPPLLAVIYAYTLCP